MYIGCPIFVQVINRSSGSHIPTQFFRECPPRSLSTSEQKRNQDGGGEMGRWGGGLTAISSNPTQRDPEAKLGQTLQLKLTQKANPRMKFPNFHAPV